MTTSEQKTPMFFNNTVFAQRTVLVTGGSRGIGRSLVKEFAACGAHVLINYRGNHQAAEECLKDIADSNGTGELLCFDVSSAQEVEAALKGKSIDILINNAGISKDQLFVRLSERDWDDLMNINLKSAFLVSKMCLTGMMKRRFGRIINMSSVIGLSGNAGQVAYAASKSALSGFTKSLAKEFASRNITVNSVAPGYIHTDMTSALGEDWSVELKKKIPLGRIGQPSDVAAACLFLASEGASYITGQTLTVDGGLIL